MSTQSNSFFFGPVRRAFLLVYTVFPRILQDFSLRNPFVFAAFFPAFNTFPAPCPSIASGFAAAPFSEFLVLRLRKSLQILPRQRAFARVSLRETGLFLCGVSADRRPSHGGFGRGRTRFIEGFLNFAKRELLYKKPARPVSLPYRTLKALLQEISLLRGKTKGFLNLQSVCCVYKSLATCFSALPRPERLCGLFPCVSYSPALSGVVGSFAGLKQGLDNRKKVFLIGGMQPPNIKFQP